MSEICSEDLINRLFSLNTTNIGEKEWPLILTSVERKENIHCLPKVSEAIFGTLLNKLDITTIECRVLWPVLQFLKKIFLSRISYAVNLVKIHSNNQNNEVSIELCQLLEVCLNVLGGYFILIDNLTKLGVLKHQYVKSVTITLPSVLLASFNHCQESEKLYGVYFSSATVLLTALFRKSYEISNLFYKWIDEFVTFDFKMEDDTNMLIKALETMYSVGEIVVQLDVKTMVEHWKGLIKITCKYAYFLKERLDISHPMKFLTSSLEDTIAEITQQKEINEKLRIRNLKLSSFILKVVVKLCEVYNGFLNGCEACLLNLILLLNRCSRSCRKNNNEEMERFIVVGAAPLLFHLLDDRSFLERFSSLSSNLESLSSEEAVGFLFTHLRLLKFLISSNDEVKESWLKIPLVSNTMSLFSICYSVLNLNIKIEDSDAYTYLVSTTAAFMISCFTPEKFFEVEIIFLEHIFNSRIETGILASDLLVLLGRLTNEEVCLNQTKFLCQILCSMDCSGIQRPEASVVGLTVGRLFHLLSGNGQDFIVKQFQPLSNPHLWLYLNCDLEISHNIISNVSLCKEVQNLSPLNYMHMMELVALYKNINGEKSSNNLNYHVNQLWSGFEAYHRSDDRQPDWWFYIFFLLTKVISLNAKMGSFVTEKVLNDLLELTALKQSSINYYICNMIKNLAPSVSLKNCSTVSDIFINCMSSDNFLVKQLAIESFVHFSGNGHDSIIRNVSSDPGIEYYLSDYYKKIPICTANSIINFSFVFFHKCFVYDKDIHPNKKFKHNLENQEIKNLLCHFLECVNLIKDFTKQRELSPEERKTISLAICDLEKL